MHWLNEQALYFIADKGLQKGFYAAQHRADSLPSDSPSNHSLCCKPTKKKKYELFQHRILGRFLEGWLLQDLRSRVWTASRLLRVGLWRKPHAAKQEHPGDPYLLEDGISSRFCYLHNPFGKLRFCGRIRHHVNSRRGGSERRVLPGGIVQVKKKSDSSSLSSYLGKESKK